jgi:hypothetical protein
VSPKAETHPAIETHRLPGAGDGGFSAFGISIGRSIADGAAGGCQHDQCVPR